MNKLPSVPVSLIACVEQEGGAGIKGETTFVTSVFIEREKLKSSLGGWCPAGHQQDEVQ